MDYKKMLCLLIEKYYKEVIEPYKETTMDAMSDAKKFGLFKKRNFIRHVENFKNHEDVAKEIRPDVISIPEDDDSAKELSQKLKDSVDSFVELCKANEEFYVIMDRKQHRDSGLKISEYREAFSKMQKITAESVVSLDDLDNTYRQYYTANFSD